MNEIPIVLIQGRHPIVWDDEEVTAGIWPDLIEPKFMHNHEWLERSALGWLNTLPKNKVHIRLFVTGLSQALVAFLKMYDIVYMHRSSPPQLTLMFYDMEKESYSESVWDE